ncbi:MAG TPA: dihydrodipicolinate synthase family protein, partial [Acidimicrobiales bacterium]|nr:dihydrodipicolinate synthase family protein [Acidimicrobiales bacterium]
MQSSHDQRLHGTWATVLLPIAPDESIDLGRLREELEVLVSAELAGCYTNGTAGELHALDEAEHDAVSEIVAQRCGRAGVAFQIGASHMSGQICLSRIRRARELAPAAIQVTLPDWLPLGPDEVIAAVSRMAEVADPVPIVLYNPPHAKTICDVTTFAALSETVPGLAGIKVVPDGGAWLDSIRVAAPRLAVFVPGHDLASGLERGAAGSYSNIACLSPDGAGRFEATARHSRAEGLDLERRIKQFLAEHIGPLQAEGYSNTALDKTLATIGDWAPVGTRVRWPYKSVPEEQARTLAPLARRRLPELFSSE